MAVILALEALRDACVDRFTIEETFGAGLQAEIAAEKANPFGWREPPRQLVPTSQIVWVPGDPSGVLGEIVGPRYPGTHPNVQARPLLNLWESFTCFVCGADTTPGFANDERAQYHATRLLYDVWLRAVYLAAVGTFKIRSQRWLTDKTERRYGATIEVIGAMLAVIPDAIVTSAPVDTAADVTTTELDQTDPTDHIEAP